MRKHTNKFLGAVCALFLLFSPVFGQIGTRFPSERKVIKDPVTGAELVFLTSQQGKGDRKIYQTHNQWTSDGKWLIFGSSRAQGEAIAVNEETGVMVQVTEGGYTGMLNIARNSMKLYFMRSVRAPQPAAQPAAAQPAAGQPGAAPRNFQRGDGRVEIVEVDLAKLFADSEAGKLKAASEYQKVCGVTPPEIGAGGDMALDGGEEVVYFRVGREEAARHLPEGTKLESNFGPRNMGAGPSGIASMDLKTGVIKHVISVPFQVGHIQTNPWVPGEIVFCWETGGKAPQRTWTVKADGTGLRPVFVEAEHDWVTHEAVITKDEVAVAIMGHRAIRALDGSVAKVESTTANPGQEDGWGISGTRAFATGLAIINLRTRDYYLAGQTKSGSGLWHVSGSGDGRFAVGDDFNRDIWLIDRKNNEMMLLSSGHKATASDHPHPTFSPDGTKIQIQSAMLSEDNRSMNICVIKVPEAWLKRTYK
jgi:oligogalacturonide lyase